MALPPDVRAKLAAATADVRQMQIDRLSIEQSVEELSEDDDGDGVPLEELVDDPSVVREVERLQRVERRVRRTSDRPATMPAILVGGARR